MDDDEIGPSQLDHLWGGDTMGGVKPYRRTLERGREPVDTSKMSYREGREAVAKANALFEQGSQLLRKAANDSERLNDADTFSTTMLKIASRTMHRGAKEMAIMAWLAKRRDDGDDLNELIAGIEAKDARHGEFLRGVALRYKLLD
jgi:hypothetical protein